MGFDVDEGGGETPRSKSVRAPIPRDILVPVHAAIDEPDAGRAGRRGPTIHVAPRIEPRWRKDFVGSRSRRDHDVYRGFEGLLNITRRQQINTPVNARSAGTSPTSDQITLVA